MKNKQIKSYPRLLYLVNVDWFFLSHRLPLALAARKEGYEVWVACSDTGQGKKIRETGLHYILMPLSRSGTNLLVEVKLLIYIFRLYLRIRPDIVHLVTIKPVLYGAIIARLFFRKIKVVNAVTGLGFTFAEASSNSLISKIVKVLYRFALKNKNAVAIFQNPDDLQTFIGQRLIQAGQARLIKGSGVDCNVFKPTGVNPEVPLVLLASRMIWDKGISEFVESSRILKKSGYKIRFVLAGIAEKDVPNAVNEDLLIDWNKEGIIEWLGYQSNMPVLINSASLVALPTYYPEGVPKFLIEAAACGKPIITTNRPGCTEIVKENINGLLIPEKSPESLAEAIKYLIHNPDVSMKFGRAGRDIVIMEFSLEIVILKTLNLYKELLKSH